MMKMMMMTIMGKFVERAHNRETGKGTRRYLAMLENGNWGPGCKRALHRTRGPEVSPNIIQMWNQLLKRNICLLSNILVTEMAKIIDFCSKQGFSYGLEKTKRYFL